MSTKHKSVCRLKLHPAMTYDEIAVRLGISRQSVQKLCESGLRKLREHAKSQSLRATLEDIDRARSERERGMVDTPIHPFKSMLDYQEYY